VGGLKPFKLLKCILAGGKKASSFAIFGLCAAFRANCKCACLCVVAWYKLRILCFILSGGWRNFVKRSYNFNGVRYNFTDKSYNFTGARNNLYNGSYNFYNARNNFDDERYKTTKGYYIKHGGYYTFLLSIRKCQAANCFVLGTCRTENRLDIRFNVNRCVNNACVCFIKYVISGNTGID
jgi:hypothetical protein